MLLLRLRCAAASDPEMIFFVVETEKATEGEGNVVAGIRHVFLGCCADPSLYTYSSYPERDSQETAIYLSMR